MNPIEKALRKFSPAERLWTEDVIERIISNKNTGLDIKKLRGREDIFRVRKGNIRVIYMKKHGDVFILHIGKRNDKTYSF